MFGKRSSCAIPIFAGHLNKFNDALQYQQAYSSEFIINSLTLTPYFSRYLPPECYQKICNDLCKGNIKSVFYRTGIMANRIPMPEWLRYCPACQQIDEQKYGECYWHRRHQLPGIEICTDHIMFLENSSVSLRAGRKHSEFICATRYSDGSYSRRLDLSNRNHQIQLCLAREAVWLLENPIQGTEPNSLRNRYLQLLIKHGYATYTGSIKVIELLRDFCEFYPQDLLRQLHCEFSGNDTRKTNWLLTLVRKPRNTLHPLYHLLLLHFLGEKVKGFFSLPNELRLFGDAPWPCLNAAADHYREPVVLGFRLGKRLREHRPVGKFYCECGFCYSRSGPDQMPEDRYRIGKVISFGKVWERKLKQLWKSKSLTITQIARQLNVDPLTSKRHAVRLGLPFSGNKERLTALRQSDQLRSDKETSERDKRTQCRNSWFKLLRETPNISMKTLRQRLPQTYQWLILNDAAWLKKHQPFKLWKPRDTSSVNWGLRDLEMVEAIKDAATRIQQKGPRLKRITKTAIGKELGHTTLLQQ